MATLPKVLINQADSKSAGGVALRVRTQARAFHADVSDAMLGEPRPQRFQLARGCAKAAQQLLRSASWHADQNATDNASLVHVQTRTSFEDSFHHHHLS
jgi:hypothetical protein